MSQKPRCGARSVSDGWCCNVKTLHAMVAAKTRKIDTPAW